MIDKTIIRIKKGSKNPYLMVLRSVAQDDRLSLKSRGLMLYLLSLPDDWQIYQREIAKHFPDGEFAIRGAFKQLKNYGYIKSTRLRDEKGTYCGYEYVLFEEPPNYQLLQVVKKSMAESYSGMSRADVEQAGLTYTEDMEDH